MNGEKVLATSWQEVGLEKGLIFNDSVKKYKKDMQALSWGQTFAKWGLWLNWSCSWEAWMNASVIKMNEAQKTGGKLHI